MLFHLLACTDPAAPVETGDARLDLTETLAADEVRAGKVTDPAALFGGVSAEGSTGDLKIYNDRVQFVVQAPGDSSYYVEYGGGLIDADLVRAAGVPGRDLLDEITPMVGLGRIVNATSVTVLSDGQDGTAVIRVEGPAAPMQLLTGALENPTLIPELDLRVRTDYALAPGSWSLEATTTVWNDETESVELAIGQVALLASDVAEAWQSRAGREEADGAPVDLVGAMGMENEVALAITAQAPLESGAVGRILSQVAPAIIGFGPTSTVAPDASVSWTSWVGVAPDLATLSGEQLARTGAAAQPVSGTVTAGGAPVAGARVHVLDADDAPLTIALTDATGAWSASVPAGPVSFVATGRGTSIQTDLPAGHGWVSPYEPHPAATLASLADGAPGAPFAEGYGLSAVTTTGDIELTAPGLLHVTVTDGGPAVVLANFAAGDPVAADARLVPGRPSGAAAVGFVRDGGMDLRLEPGTYDIVAYRGVRDELVRETVTIVSGETTELVADIVPAYTVDGFLVLDPHSHASPSGDGGIAMADRLLVTAANGVDVHFGTDHDHTVDYRPLLAPLGLEDRLASVVATEVSPVLRGHFNVWPATVDRARVNGGAPRWWFGYADTAEIFGWMREMVGEDGIVQANHPVGSSGMFSLSGYELDGTVSAPDKWSFDFDAMELLNSGDWSEYLPYYLDLVARGRAVTPVGVSDSHAHMSGGVGVNVTFLRTGGALADLDDDVLRSAMAERATVVSHGPFVDARIDGAWAPGATVGVGSVLSVEVKAPSWMPVETLTLHENGVPVATEPCLGVAPTPCVAAWPLAPVADAFYVVTAASTTRGMEGAHAGTLAWAATAATFVDVAGDGWTAPLSPIELED